MRPLSLSDDESINEPPSPNRSNNGNDLFSYDYFMPAVSRVEAEQILREIKEVLLFLFDLFFIILYLYFYVSHVKNGVFIVRKKEPPVPGQPYSITIFNDNTTYNLEIRQLNSKKYALGREKYNELVISFNISKLLL